MSRVISRSLIPVGALPTMSRSGIHAKRCFKSLIPVGARPTMSRYCIDVKSCFKVLDSSWGTANDEQILHRCQELFQGPCFQLGHCRRRADLASMSSVVSRSLTPVGALPTMSRSCIDVKSCFSVLDSNLDPTNNTQICSFAKSCFRVLESSGHCRRRQILHTCQALFQGP